MRQILEPRDHLHINHERTFEADCGHAQISQFWFTLAAAEPVRSSRPDRALGVRLP